MVWRWIKRRTENIYPLASSLKDQLYTKAFGDLKINMLRFFIHHSILPADNNTFNTTYYSNSGSGHKNVASVISEGLAKSSVPASEWYIIGNANTAPGWMKSNGSHKRASDAEDVKSQ